MFFKKGVSIKYNMKNIVGIHQPNFFPWLGYFHKIMKVDHFVFLDDVQFPKSDGNWTNRVPLLFFGEMNWATAPIERNFSGKKNINQINIRNENIWKSKLLKTLKMSYKKHPFYLETIDVIEPLILSNEQKLSKYNINSIKTILNHLQIDSRKIKLSSNLNQKGSSNELLINLTKYFSSNIYMCGGGADGYQDENIFNKNNIKLLYQNFQHPFYNQFKQKNFIKGLSIIDCLMNLGWEQTSNLIKNV